MLEKAFAKTFVTYSGVYGGNNCPSCKGLGYLSGMPTVFSDLTDTRYFPRDGGDKKLWGLVMKGTENKYPMLTSPMWRHAEYLERGSYTVLKAV